MERSCKNCLTGHIKFCWSQSPENWSAKQGYCAVNKFYVMACDNFFQSHNEAVSNSYFV